MTARPLPHDPALPNLKDLFPAEGAPLFLAQAVEATTGLPVDARAATIDYVRWRPGRHCTVLWSFSRAGDQPLLASGQLRAQARRGDPSTGAIQLLDGRFKLEVFPFDDRLPGLPFAADAGRVGDALGVELAAVVPVSHKPTRRCVLRYADEQGDVRFFGKVFRDDRGAPIMAWVAGLRVLLAARDARWELPPAVAYLPEPRLLLFEAVEGAVELSQLLRGADAGGDAGWAGVLTAITRAAEGLAEFCGLSVDGPPALTADEILGALDRGRRQLEPLLPDLAGSVDLQVRALAHAAAGLPAEPLGLAHGAFRHGQLLVRGDRIVVLDLDSLCLAGQALDPGCFLAGLDATAVRSPRLRPLLAVCEARFVDGLDGAAHVDPRWLAWHRAAACLEHALRAAFALDLNWPERAALFVESASRAIPTPSPV
jgi:hypothetical protein